MYSKQQQTGKKGKPNLKPDKDKLMARLPDTCELRFVNCLKHLMLTLAHRHNRWWYKKKPELLWSYNQVLVTCVKCHDRLDANKEFREQTFIHKRGSE